MGRTVDESGVLEAYRTEDYRTEGHAWWSRLERVLPSLIVVVSVLIPLLFLRVALLRMHYPYELEQLEGNMFFAAWRAYHHQPVYSAPSLSFIPYMYPPGYYWAAAALGEMTGSFSMATLRLLSVLSTLGCFGVLYALVWRETRSVLASLVAMGLYAGCYSLCGGWFDFARLDSFFIFLFLVALFATRWSYPLPAALCWIACFQTKQSILPVAFAVLCYDFRNRGRTVAGLLSLAIGAAATVLWLNHTSAGWYSFYVFRVPSANADVTLHGLGTFAIWNLLRPLALALAIVLSSALFYPVSLPSKRSRFWLCTCSVFPVFWWVGGHSGSTVNSPMPIYAVLAALVGLALHRLLGVCKKNGRATLAGRCDLPRFFCWPARWGSCALASLILETTCRQRMHATRSTT